MNKRFIKWFIAWHTIANKLNEFRGYKSQLFHQIYFQNNTSLDAHIWNILIYNNIALQYYWKLPTDQIIFFFNFNLPSVCISSWKQIILDFLSFEYWWKYIMRSNILLMIYNSYFKRYFLYYKSCEYDISLWFLFMSEINDLLNYNSSNMFAYMKVLRTLRFE